MYEDSISGGGGPTRRAFLAGGFSLVATGTLAGRVIRRARRRAWWLAADPPRPVGSQRAALAVLGRSSLRTPDSLPNPLLPAGTDTMPEIEHVVVLMLENHSAMTWADYNASYPTRATMELYPANDTAYKTNAPPISQFFSDAKAGKLPQFSLVGPDYGTQSQENPQNMAVGEAFLASPPSSSARTRSVTTSAPSSTTTPRSSPSWSASGTSPR